MDYGQEWHPLIPKVCQAVLDMLPYLLAQL